MSSITEREVMAAILVEILIKSASYVLLLNNYEKEFIVEMATT